MAKYNEDDEDTGKTRNKPQMPHEAKMIIFGIVAIICLIILIIFIFGSWYTIDAGDRGVVLTFGQASQDISQPGFHFKVPLIQKVVVYSIRTQTIKFDNPLKAGVTTPSEYDALSSASKDLQTVQTAVIVNYHINEKDVLNIYQQYGDPQTYQVNVLEPIIRNSVKATTAHYDAIDLVDKREAVVKEATDFLSTQFSAKNAVLDNFNIVNFAYSDQFTAAIENKVTQQQNALAEQNKLVAVQFQAQQRVAQAKGEADAIAIQVQAINQQGGQSYVNLQAIQKWNGALPVVMGGNAVPFINMNTLAAGGAVASGAVTATTSSVSTPVNLTG